MTSGSSGWRCSIVASRRNGIPLSTQRSSGRTSVHCIVVCCWCPFRWMTKHYSKFGWTGNLFSDFAARVFWSQFCRLRGVRFIVDVAWNARTAAAVMCCQWCWQTFFRTILCLPPACVWMQGCPCLYNIEILLLKGPGNRNLAISFDKSENWNKSMATLFCTY